MLTSERTLSDIAISASQNTVYVQIIQLVVSESMVVSNVTWLMVLYMLVREKREQILYFLQSDTMTYWLQICLLQNERGLVHDCTQG